ncbi:cation:dicarboxylase symporter family transporter [Virgibacillus halodenitrificans]|uniref:dicarboxylate/amino acid:cation symporter n=1 Tax=Virgibacillus halodenitrificans TaxID=1482 RepID=UPI00045D21B2|nr:dicarboxylate/amino acid:cation symporter [Virgibacillus halodenitrificans]MCG1027682.1 dicarboxylate/amino acid:cation symporter [Virgibacillus halodenitrificans]MCJ0932199.1 dicarboxylate/amino acid:cation symporter [Virgibacillus halodenitrificans]MEC2157731.1 dicarboxylate/amino acid:cation symporter [Virgibacillus halodenitrificans]MYL44063.1 cation:dicarboxylase symporter family transporter [Virgibacillus halodenitrificans]CDQ31835.1 Glutamate-aspartate carrier protein [Virgibacillus 
MRIWKKYKDSSFVLKMAIGFLAGALVGILFGKDASIISPLGTLLIHLLSLIAIPVIFLTVVLAVNQMNIKQLGKIGGKLISYYMMTTAAAVLIGLALALFFRPGANLTLPNADVEKPETPHISDVILGIVPENIFQAFTAGDLMSILFLAIIIGMGISTMKFSTEEKMRNYGEMLDTFFNALNELFFKILKGVLLYAPIGIFAISAQAFGSQGWSTLASLLKLAGVFYLGILILWVVVYAGFLKISKTPVFPFFKNTKEAYTTAFFTSSSIASLPVAIDAAKKAGISERTANFALPLGAVFNSDGGALRMGISLVFAANITNLSLSPTDFFVIVLIGTLLSIGTAGVPAAGLVTLSAVLSMFGLPLEIVALIAGVDALIGMGGTASNVLGDIVGAAFVDHTGKEKTAT